MRNLHDLDAWRDTRPETIAYLRAAGVKPDSEWRHGVFFVPTKTHASGRLKVLVSVAMGWDHVSVSLPDRCPTWDEMEMVKRAFFREFETAMQLHVPAADHISYHPFTLHMWRPHGRGIPRPPDTFVGAASKRRERVAS